MRGADARAEKTAPGAGQQPGNAVHALQGDKQPGSAAQVAVTLVTRASRGARARPREPSEKSGVNPPPTVRRRRSLQGQRGRGSRRRIIPSASSPSSPVKTSGRTAVASTLVRRRGDGVLRRQTCCAPGPSRHPLPRPASNRTAIRATIDTAVPAAIGASLTHQRRREGAREVPQEVSAARELPLAEIGSVVTRSPSGKGRSERLGLHRDPAHHERRGAAIGRQEACSAQGRMQRQALVDGDVAHAGAARPGDSRRSRRPRTARRRRPGCPAARRRRCPRAARWSRHRPPGESSRAPPAPRRERAAAGRCPAPAPKSRRTARSCGPASGPALRHPRARAAIAARCPRCRCPPERVPSRPDSRRRPGTRWAPAAVKGGSRAETSAKVSGSSRPQREHVLAGIHRGHQGRRPQGGGNLPATATPVIAPAVEPEALHLAPIESVDPHAGRILGHENHAVSRVRPALRQMAAARARPVPGGAGVESEARTSTTCARAGAASAESNTSASGPGARRSRHGLGDVCMKLAPSPLP